MLSGRGATFVRLPDASSTSDASESFMAQRVYLAIDMGASSGRHVAGLSTASSCALSEVYRFENGPIAS